MKVLEVDRHNFRVVGSCQGTDLKSAVVGTLAEQERVKERERQQLEKGSLYKRRRIAHPLFKNGTLEQVWLNACALPGMHI